MAYPILLFSTMRFYFYLCIQFERMNNLSKIIAPIEKSLQSFEEELKSSLSGHATDYQPMVDYIANLSGKRIRPILLFLSAELCGKSNEKSVDFAVILELVHTATLIHDDVVDSTLERRGEKSVNAVFNNKMAVLLGDFVLSLAIKRGVAAKNHRLLEVMSEVSQSLAQGEISQLISSRKHIVSETRYFDIIKKKTALLIASCTELGAVSANTSEEESKTLRLIGEKLGNIFQIKDDIFDYFEQGEIGKPTGNDIREGKVTLPLIYAFEHAPKEIADSMYKLLDTDDLSAESIHTLIEFAKEYKGIDYAEAKMEEIKQETLTLLNRFPDSDSKEKFVELIDYIINRKK